MSAPTRRAKTPIHSMGLILTYRASTTSKKNGAFFRLELYTKDLPISSSKSEFPSNICGASE